MRLFTTPMSNLFTRGEKKGSRDWMRLDDDKIDEHTGSDGVGVGQSGGRKMSVSSPVPKGVRGTKAGRMLGLERDDMGGKGGGGM